MSLLIDGRRIVTADVFALTTSAETQAAARTPPAAFCPPAAAAGRSPDEADGVFMTSPPWCRPSSRGASGRCEPRNHSGDGASPARVISARSPRRVTLAHLRPRDDRGVDVDPAHAAGASGERITWLGHATLLLAGGGGRPLTGPLLRDRVGHLRRHAEPPAAALSEDIDAVLVSHLHLDHLDVGSLRRLSRRVPVLAPTGGGALLRRLGFANTVELPVGDETQIGGAQVRAVPAVHDGRRHPLAPLADAIGYVGPGAPPPPLPR